MSKKSRNEYPSGSRTSWKVVITYLFVIALCAALFYYIFNLRKSIENQRSNITSQHNALNWVNEFTKNVHAAQNAANLYAFTEQTKYRREFNSYREAIKAQTDTLNTFEVSEDNKQMVNDIYDLIMSKGRLSNELSKQFHDFNPFAEFDRTIDEYRPPKPQEEIVVTTVSKDTIIHVPKKAEKKGFWQRVGNVFNSKIEEPQDSLVHISMERSDTIRVQHQGQDSVNILASLRVLSDKAKTEYWKKIKQYENKTQELVKADNQLSEQISNLLIRLNQEILDSTIAEIEKSEQIIQENTHNSILMGAVTLGLIIIFIILIISDVNKGYRARRAAEEAKKKTEEIMESRHKLLLSVSHDIKAPLTSIMGHVELMDKSDEKDIVSIQQSADHILNLLNNLLEYSSLEQGKLQISNETFDIGELCEEIVEMFAPIAKHKNLEFHFENDIEPKTLLNSDKLKIRQILTNIISNGIKYTLQGSVWFKARLGRSLVVFDIIDTGVGIPQDKLEEVFKPFVRIETYNQFAEGSGYGMSVVKGLVDLLGGEIHTESEVGKGSHFEVRIPVEKMEKQPEEVVEVEENNKKSLNILVFDDDNTLLSVIGSMLHRLGHRAIACRSLSDFDNAMQQIQDYDYILTDREMGAVTGNDILILAKEADPHKPIILMTGRIEYTTEKAKEEGFDGFLQKPFNMKQLESLFGSVASSEKGSGTAFPDFPAFSEMMGNDKEAMTGILEVFVQSTANDLVEMNTLIEQSNFVEMQGLCHKMLPMFIQLERDTTFLARMNAMRGKDEGEADYPEWKEDAAQFMAQTDELMDLLAEKYNIS